jgi:hypothetical protein
VAHNDPVWTRALDPRWLSQGVTGNEGTQMGDLPAPNPAQARKVWEGMARPSTRRVAKKLRQSGASISHETVARWRRRGWRPLEREQHPLDAGREQLDDAVPLLTGDPITVAEDLAKASSERAEIERLPDGELLQRAARALAVDVTVVCEAFLHQPEAVVYKPAELAVLFRALTACAQAASAAFAQPVIQAINPKTGVAHPHDAT